MRCFNHPELRAVGLCKQCHKGLCHDCAADLGHALACRGVHEEAVGAVESLVTRNVELSKQSRGRLNWLLWPLFYAFLGLVFLAIEATRGGAPRWPGLVVGGAFFTLGVVLCVLQLRAWRVAKGSG